MSTRRRSDMGQRLEFHADYQDFFRTELEKLGEQVLALTWLSLYEVLTEEANARFDGAVCGFCSGLEWPTISGHDLARACARLHFALWACHRLPWETTERPVDGEGYLRMMLIDRYWMYRAQWLAEAWGGVSLGED